MKSVLFCLLLVGAAIAQPKTLVLDTIVRDFNAWPQANAHPDFEGTCSDARGVVSFELDTDGKPVLISTQYATLPNPATFAQWYRDVPGVNAKVLKQITLTETFDGSGIYTYNNNEYFPIDGEGMTPTLYGYGHNFHFTTEVSTRFTYRGGEVFSFSGDDDVWVYINNRLAVDLGGCHPPESASTNLDVDAAKLGIEVGKTYSLKIFNAERHTAGSNFGVTTSIELIAVPENICGDGVVQGPEECDDGTNNGVLGSCCTVDCTIADAATVCRPSAGDCDIPETCTGSSATCPSDAVKAAATPCGELFGACDVQLQKSCTGTDAQCYGPPPALSILGLKFSDFTVTSFGGFTCRAGDVEGRLAVMEDAVFDGFTVGLQLTLATDGWNPITVLVGGNASWTSGSLHPDGGKTDDVSVKGPATYLSAGGNLTGDASEYIYWMGGNDVQSAFAAGQAYYTSVQSQLANLPINAAASMQYGDGLAIKCTSSSDLLYHVSITAAMLGQTNWYSLENCRFDARWVIDVVGSDDVTIKGGQFPGIVERVIYNILGSGRTITANNGVNGHIFAPQNSFYQAVGVTYGLVIAGDIPLAKQNNKPNCKNFRAVTITSELAVGMKAGDKTIYVVDWPSLVAGDNVCVNGQCNTLVNVEQPEIRLVRQEKSGGALVFANAFTADAAAGSEVKIVVMASQDRSTPLEYKPSTEIDWEGDASVLGASVVVAAFAAYLLN